MRALTIAAALCLAACSSANENRMPDAAEVATKAASAPTDPQIAAIVVAANEADIAAGEQAAEKAESEQVKEFARTMVRDHTAANQQATELVQRVGITPEENDTSRSITTNAGATRERLAGMSGPEYDRAYVDSEVEYHQFVLSALDNELIPSAQNAELKALLEQVRPAFQAHLDHARQLQQTLAGTAPGATR